MKSTVKDTLVFRRLWQALGWLMISLVVLFTLLPDPPKPPVISWDKGQHLLSYVVLMFWFRIAFAPRIFWVGFLVGLGVSLEFLQGWSGYRHFEYADMLTNSLGVLMGLLLAATPLRAWMARLDHWLAAQSGWEPGAPAYRQPVKKGAEKL